MGGEGLRDAEMLGTRRQSDAAGRGGSTGLGSVAERNDLQQRALEFRLAPP